MLNPPVWIVAGRAPEPHHAAHLMRMCDLLEFLLFRVAPIASLGFVDVHRRSIRGMGVVAVRARHVGGVVR